MRQTWTTCGLEITTSLRRDMKEKLTSCLIHHLAVLFSWQQPRSSKWLCARISHGVMRADYGIYLYFVACRIWRISVFIILSLTGALGNRTAWFILIYHYRALDGVLRQPTGWLSSPASLQPCWYGFNIVGDFDTISSVYHLSRFRSATNSTPSNSLDPLPSSVCAGYK